MAMNPMKRRARNSFLIGFLCALIIMALIVMLLLYKMQDLKQNYEKLESQQKEVFVASDYIQSGTEVTIASFKKEKVQTSISDNEMVRAIDFQQENEDGSVIDKTIQVLEEVENQTTNDQRLQEYNMIVLPTKLAADDYIDVRIQFPTGEDYVVVSKKKVVEADEKTIWMKMNEDEILMLGNAIVEAYITEGSYLYVNRYTEPGMQTAATPTYLPNNDVIRLMEQDPNITTEAKNALFTRNNSTRGVIRDNGISAIVNSQENGSDNLVKGVTEEITKSKEERQKYLEDLGGY